MTKVSVFNQNVEEYEAWYEKNPEVYESEIQAIKDQMLTLPQNIIGIEVGLGTGRFAEPLGIKEGIEPSQEMRNLALEKGIEVMDARAERLPYQDMHFDFVLFVTICHLDDVKAAFEEAHRVLKPGGALIVGFIDKNSPIGQEYEERRSNSKFYRQAKFYPSERVKSMLEDLNFKDLSFIQTLFGKLDEIDTVQASKPGHSEGSFVVVKARKKT